MSLPETSRSLRATGLHVQATLREHEHEVPRMDGDRWMFGATQPSSTARVRLFCFAHAGAGASLYVPWLRKAPAFLDVKAIQLPGRENRFVEAPLTSVEQIVDALEPRIETELDRPFAFFGHSFGALIAWSLAHRLVGRGKIPAHFFASAFRGPHLQRRMPWVGALDDMSFLAAVRAQTGATSASLPDDPEFLPLVLPALRADFGAAESFTYRERGPLPVPLTAVRGADDPMVTPIEIAAWAQHTSKAFHVVTVPGDHFYVKSQPDAVTSLIFETLAGEGER